MAEKKQIKDKCKACRKPIIWLVSPKTGKQNVPVNPDNVAEDDLTFNIKKHTSHFATCIYASALRSKKAGPPSPPISKGGSVYPTVDEIMRDRAKVREEFKAKLLADKRPFILQNKLDITMTRYGLLNRAAELGLEFDKLISYSSGELWEWLSERDAAGEQEEIINARQASRAGYSQAGLFD